jgi:hypothetical protein
MRYRVLHILDKGDLSMPLKALATALVGRRNLGRLDYLLRRVPKDPWGGPFNGQVFRRRIYIELTERFNFDGIVETGTFRGTTTEFLAQSGLPVYSVEIDPRAHGFASRRLWHCPLVHLFQGNSPDFLGVLATRAECASAHLFFYLDAHVQNAAVYHEAPLVEELDIIFRTWPDAVVMVDDFEVPGSDYSYDDWGSGRTLNVQCLEPLVSLGLVAFFPALEAKRETGCRRGCVVLGREPGVVERLRSVSTLTRRPSSDRCMLHHSQG